MDRNLKSINFLPKGPKAKISARSVAPPNRSGKGAKKPLQSILKNSFSPRPRSKPQWTSNDPKKPFTTGPKVEGDQANRADVYSFFKEAYVKKLDKDSLQRIRDICWGRLGNLVIRRVKSITPSKEGRFEFFLHSPESRKQITEEEYMALDEETKYHRVEIMFYGDYSLVTSKKSPMITRDKFEGKAFFAKNTGRAEFDPMTLNLELVENGPMPRISNKKAPVFDDPASLVCGYATRDPHTNKLFFKKWTIISVQEQRAILAMLEPKVTHVSTKKGEIKDPDSYRAWLLGGGRLSTNLFRRKVCSESASGTPLSEKEKEKIYTRYIGSSWGLHHCHILVFWVLMCKYGELPGNDNIPTVIVGIPPSDPNKEWYEDKPIPWWDLPKMNVTSLVKADPSLLEKLGNPKKKELKSIRMDRLLVAQLGLKYSIVKIRIPVHERVRFPPKIIRAPKLEDQIGQNDVAELVPSVVLRTDADDVLGLPTLSTSPDSDSDDRDSEDRESDTDSGTETGSDSGLSTGTETVLSDSLDSGLSSDSETGERSSTPSTDVEVTVLESTWVFKTSSTWADDDGEMDFDSPLTLTPLTSSIDGTLDENTKEMEMKGSSVSFKSDDEIDEEDEVKHEREIESDFKIVSRKKKKVTKPKKIRETKESKETKVRTRSSASSDKKKKVKK